MLQEVLDVLSAVESQNALDTIQLQAPALGIYGDVVPVRRKPHCLRCCRVRIAKVCQFNLV
jgi:hypothetical protein